MKNYNELSNKEMLNKRKKELESIKKLFEINKLSKALKEIEKYCNTYPGDYFGIYLKAQIYKALNELDYAEELFIRISESSCNNKYSALVEVAKIEEIKGNYQLAKEYYERAVNESPNKEIYALFALERIACRNNNFQEALAYLNEIPKDHSNRIYLEHAKIARYQYDYAQAAADLSKISVTPNDKFNREVALEKGKVESYFDNYEEAIMYFNEAKKTERKDKVYFEAIISEATMYYDKKDYDKALRVIDSYTNFDGLFDGKVELLLGKIKTKLNRVKDAYNHFLIALDLCLNEDKDEVLKYLGNIELELGNYTKSLEYYNLMNKKTKSVYYKLLAISIREKNYQDSYKYLEIIKGIDPTVVEDQSYINAKLLVDKLAGKKLVNRNHTYIENQIIDYSLDKAKAHVKKSSITREEQFNNKDIDDLFLEAKLLLDDEYKIHSEILDIYDIPYKNVGYSSKEIINVLRVVTIPETHEILTLYPCSKENLKSHINKKDFNKSLTKTNKPQSQIDKFKKKYNLN